MTDEPTTDTIPDAAEIAPPAVRAIIDAPVMRPMTTPMLGAEPPTTTATATPQPDVPSWMNTLPGTTPEDIAAKMRNRGVITANSFETLPTQGIEVGTRATVNGGTWDAGEWVWAGTTWVKSAGAGQVSDTLGDDLFEFANNTNWSSQYRAWLSAGAVFLSLRLVRKTNWPQQSTAQSIEKVGNVKVPAFRPPWFVHAPAFATGTPNNKVNSIGLRVDQDGSIRVETLEPNVGLNANGIIQGTITWPCEWN